MQEWLRKGDTAWRLASEACVLQLLTLEAFASPPGPGESHALLFYSMSDLRK